MAEPSPASLPTSGRPAGRRGRVLLAPERVSMEDLERAIVVARQIHHELLSQAVARGLECDRQLLNNALMDAFRELRSVEAFTLLFDFNVKPFTLVASRIMRLTGSRADPNDILQEAFLAIYRYPSRFRADKPNAFRNWSYSIIRNTVYRSLHKQGRDGVPADMLADVLEDPSATSPLQASSDSESDGACRQVYGLLLVLYAQAFESELKDRDRKALTLVEVEGLGYRDAAAQLEIRLENFKMVICRARKKIHQYMVRVLGTRMS